jgi:hypothetical protein
MENNLDSGSRMKSRIIHVFLRAWKHFYGLNILKFFVADPDPGSFRPWIGIRDGKQSGFGIQDKISFYISESIVTLFMA